MRVGVTVSIIAHIAVLAIGLVNLGLAEPLTPVVESIAVDLVPIEEYSNIRAGQLDSEIVETDTPSIVEDDQPAEIAQLNMLGVNGAEDRIFLRGDTSANYGAVMRVMRLLSAGGFSKIGLITQPAL